MAQPAGLAALPPLPCPACPIERAPPRSTVNAVEYFLALTGQNDPRPPASRLSTSSCYSRRWPSRLGTPMGRARVATISGYRLRHMRECAEVDQCRRPGQGWLDGEQIPIAPPWPPVARKTPARQRLCVAWLAVLAAEPAAGGTEAARAQHAARAGLSRRGGLCPAPAGQGCAAT